MAAPKGNKFAKGGRRPGAGRKPLAIREMCAKAFQERIPILSGIADETKHNPRDRIAALQVLAKVGVPEKHEVDLSGSLYHVKDVKGVEDDDL